jgi:hypothetical protein
LGIGVVDRQQGAVLDQLGVMRIGPGKGQVDADLDRLVGSIGEILPRRQRTHEGGGRQAYQ